MTLDSEYQQAAHLEGTSVAELDTVCVCMTCLSAAIFQQPSRRRRCMLVALQHAGTFYLLEDVPKLTKFMSEPIKAAPGSSPLNTPGYFVAGIVKGYLQSAGFEAECALPSSPLACSVGGNTVQRLPPCRGSVHMRLRSSRAQACVTVRTARPEVAG